MGGSSSFFLTCAIRGRHVSTDQETLDQEGGAMTITNGYATLAQEKAFLSITDSVDDDLIERSVESASRSIDRMANRRFYADASASARYYRARNGYFQIVDDISSTTGLLVDLDTAGAGTYSTSVAISTGFIVDPVNAIAVGRPITQITMIGGQLLPSFIPNLRPGVRVTARWGWPSVPTDIVEATLILAADLYKRKDAVAGIVGLSDLGSVRMGQLGRDIGAIVRAYRREVVG